MCVSAAVSVFLLSFPAWETDGQTDQSFQLLLKRTKNGGAKRDHLSSQSWTLEEDPAFFPTCDPSPRILAGNAYFSATQAANSGYLVGPALSGGHFENAPSSLPIDIQPIDCCIMALVSFSALGRVILQSQAHTLHAGSLQFNP